MTRTDSQHAARDRETSAADRHYAPSLAFVVPAYNATATLRETLRSLRAQTRGDWEALVVDDGSDDDPGALVRAMGQVMALAQPGPVRYCYRR